jgi:integrase
MQNINVYFWRRNCPDDQKRTAVYCRITAFNERVDFATDVKIENRFWDQDYQSIKTSSKEAIIGNNLLVQLRNKINEIIYRLSNGNAPITAKIIKNELKPKVTPDRILSLLQAYKKELDRAKKSNYAPSTLLKIGQSYSGMEFFITKILGKKDILFTDIDYNFIKDFEDWSHAEGRFHGRVKKRWKQNYFIGELSVIKRLTEDAFKRGIIKSTPFAGYSIKRDSATFKFLTQEEVSLIEQLEIKDNTDLSEARDLFVFCCFTGLAYADAYSLTKDSLIFDDGIGMCINKQRQKSKVEIFIPVLDKAKAIIRRYENRGSHKLLPSIPYHRYRNLLSEIEHLTGIKKPIRSHVARHTAATYFLNNNLPEEVVCRALGLSSVTVLKSTYGKFLNKTVIKHFKELTLNL